MLRHEVGRLLGQEQEANGLMAETLTAGTRLAVNGGGDADMSRFTTDVLYALLAADEETTWIGRTLFGRGRWKR